MFSDEGGFFSFFLLSSFVVPLVVIGLVVLGVVAISRSDFDPTGRRPYAFYLYAVCLVSLFVLVFSAASTVSTLSRFVGDDDESSIDFSDSESDFSGFDSSDRSSGSGRVFDPETGQFIVVDPDEGSDSENRDADDEERDAIVRDAMQVGIVGLVALGLFAFHWNRAQKLVQEPGFSESPASRVYSSYLYLVCFISAMVILVAGAIAAYAAFRVALPGITADFGELNKIEREDGFRELASAGVMTAIAALLAMIHWRQIDRPALGGTGGSQPTLAAPGNGPPPAYGGPVASPYPPPPSAPDSAYRRPPE